MSQDFTMKAGDTRKLNVTIVDEESGTPLDISSAELSWGFARNVRSEPLVEKAVGSGISIVNGPAGSCRITINPADTQGRKGKFYHELQVTETDGSVTTVMSGEMTLEATFDPSI